MTEVELVNSEHCQSLTIEGRTVQLQIFGSGKDDWILELIDEHGTSIVWDGLFETDEAAHQEFQRALKEEGIEALLEEPPGE